MKLYRFLFLIICFFALHASAQDSLATRGLPDSLKANYGDTSSARLVTEEDVGKLLNILNNSYMLLNQVNANANTYINVQQIERDNISVNSNLGGLKDNLTDTNRILTIRTLQMYSVLIAEMLTELEAWQKSLSEQEHKLEQIQQAMLKVRKNPTLHSLLSNKELRTQYHEQLQEIRKKWRTADSTNKARLNTLVFIRNKVSENYITATEAQNNVTQQLRIVMLKMFDKEHNYFWEKPEKQEKKNFSGKTYSAERSAMTYYFNKKFKSRILMSLCGIAFFIWVFRNYRYLEKSGGEKIISELRFLHKIPLSSTLIVVFTLFPFFDLHSPAVFVELVQFLLIIVISFLFWQRWPRPMFYAWMGIVVLYLLFAYSRSVVTVSWIGRILFLLLNIGACLFILFFKSQMKERVHVFSFVPPILTLSVFLNLAAILFNAFGRITVSKIIGSSSMFGVTQIISMSVFVRILMEAFYLQVQSSRAKSKFKNPIDFQDVKPLFGNILSIFVLSLWTIFFTVNLDVFDPLYDLVMRFLTQRRELGSVTFTYGNLVVFVLVLYTSFLLQKLTAYFMGIVDKDNVIAENVGKKGNRLLFARLIIIIAGFLFAVTASSLPVDRITIVFSAFGVGIGLGLQNIVSNFVSGIILLFERPFQIGDTIEIGNKMGRVKTISVRSSIIMTDAGSEIIVPNGDLLSQQVTNWTLSNRYVMRDFRVFLDGKSDFGKAKEIIMGAIRENKNIMQNMPAGVLIEEINSTFLKILVQFWVADISDTDEVKSDLRDSVFKELLANGFEVKPPV